MDWNHLALPRHSNAPLEPLSLNLYPLEPSSPYSIFTYTLEPLMTLNLHQIEPPALTQCLLTI